MKFQVFFNIKVVTVYLSPLKILRQTLTLTQKWEGKKKKKKSSSQSVTADFCLGQLPPTQPTQHNKIWQLLEAELSYLLWLLETIYITLLSCSVIVTYEEYRSISNHNSTGTRHKGTGWNGDRTEAGAAWQVTSLMGLRSFLTTFHILTAQKGTNKWRKPSSILLTPTRQIWIAYNPEKLSF